MKGREAQIRGLKAKFMCANHSSTRAPITIDELLLTTTPTPLQSQQRHVDDIVLYHVEQIRALYQNDKLFAAHQLLRHTLESIEFHLQVESIGDDVKQRHMILKAVRDGIATNRDVVMCCEEHAEAKRLLAELVDGGKQWKLAYETSDDVRVFYRHENKSDNHAIRIEGTIEGPIFNVLAIFYEIDLYKLWTPNMKQCSLLQQMSPYRLLCHFGFHLPWPFYDRTCVCYGFGVDMLETDDQSILVVVRSVPEGEYDKYTDSSTGVSAVPPVDSETDVKIDVEYAGFYIQALSPQRTRVKIITKIDPKASYIPQWLQNKALRIASPLVIRTLRKIASTVPESEDYSSRIRQKEHIYGDIRQRIERLFADTTSIHRPELKP